MRQRWRELREKDKRENDERARTVGLLVVRDGFVAVMLLIFTLALLWLLVGSERTDVATSNIAAFLPLMVIVVSGIVMGLSAALRGGFGQSSETAAYRGILLLLGTFLGIGLVMTLASFNAFGLSLSGLLPLMLGVFTGTTITVVLFVFLSRWTQR